MSDLVVNPEDRFSRVAAHVIIMNLLPRTGMLMTKKSEFEIIIISSPARSA